jgi:hypothetical protein
MEYTFLTIAVIIAIGVWGAYAFWIYITARRYGKKGNGRH